MSNRTRALVGAVMLTLPLVGAFVSGGEAIPITIAALAGTLIAVRAVWTFRHLRAGLRTPWWDVFLAGFAGAMVLMAATELDVLGGRGTGLLGGAVDEVPWRPLLFLVGTAALLAGGVTQLMMARRHTRLRSSVVSGRRPRA